MDALIGLLVAGLAIMLIRIMSQIHSRPEYTLVRIPVERQQQSGGCLPVIIFALLCLFALALFSGS